MKHTFSTLAKGKIDKDQGVIYGVSLIEMGVAKGHNLIIDQTTLQQVTDKSKVYQNGLKVKLNHGSGVDAICGRISNIRVDGEKVVGDFHLLKNHPSFNFILEMAQEQPDTFGLSVAFQGTPEAVPTGLAARVDEIFSCDLVCEPAATEALFEARNLCDEKQREKEGKTGEDEEYLGKLSSILDRLESGLSSFATRRRAFDPRAWAAMHGMEPKGRKLKPLKKMKWTKEELRERAKSKRANAIRRAEIRRISKATGGRPFSGNCGTGDGGFQPGNTCAAG